MLNDRPTPEQVLARMKTQGDLPASSTKQGKLKIFFGYAAGVGKTYAMLKAARLQKEAGVDVVIGYVEPHGRPETGQLLEDHECLPTTSIPYKGTVLHELDLDAALSRKPQLILVDELAHTNAPGSRHVKRWQDVLELLDAGIDVYTTVNVQHVESLNDVVAQITGVVVRETIPDELLNRADDVALIDLPPNELLNRLQQGKVYIPEQAARALQNFFRKENLFALRELSLRKTADRVNVDVQTAHFATAATHPWLTSERLLVCVGPSPTSAVVVRAAKRLADLFHAPWIAVHVETPQSESMAGSDRQRLLHHLKLADQLGAETVTLSGVDVVQETIEYAKSRNVTKIILGKTDEKPSRFFHRETIVDRLLKNSGHIDVHLVRGAAEPFKDEVPTQPSKGKWKDLFSILVSMAFATIVCWGFYHLGLTEANLVMPYLLAVAYVATRMGASHSIVASILAVLLFDVFFTHPYYSIAVHNTQYLVTFGVMLFVGLLISALGARVRRQAVVSRRNERRMEAISHLARGLTTALESKDLRLTVEETAREIIGAPCVLFLPESTGKIQPNLYHPESFSTQATEAVAAQWVFDHGQKAGAGTDTLPNAQATFYPLKSTDRMVGVLAIQHHDPASLMIPETRELIETLCAQIASTLERKRLLEETHHQTILAETEKLRSSLLSSISHDLRTPLAAIAGASDSLIQSNGSLPEETQKELLESIRDEAQRMTRLVENILHMTQLSSGAVKVTKQWHPVEDVIGSALNHLARQIGDRQIETKAPEESVFGFFDPVLIEQVLINLIENAIKYSPPDTPILVSWSDHPGETIMSVTDGGPGIPQGEETEIFERFFRGSDAKAKTRGTGLGLAICRAIIEAHSGVITAENRPEGGAIFTVGIPKEGSPPSLTESDQLNERNS